MSSRPAKPSGKRTIPTTTLSGEVEAEYVRTMVRILREARLNAHYPDGVALREHLGCMGPEAHQGLYAGLEIDRRSGLPTYREWTRVQTDVALADRLLRGLGDPMELERRAREGEHLIFGKNLLKHRYYSAIRGKRLVPLGEMKVALRRVDPEGHTAWFTVVLDKLGSSGLFVRFTVDLAQTDSVWNRPLLRLDEDAARHTEPLRSLVFRFASLDAELTFLKLASLDGIEVERVVKGTVGPVLFAGQGGSGPMGELMAEHGRGFVAAFPLDMAACDLEEDRDNDPLADLMARSLSEEGRAEYEQTRERMGYRVFKDRKFVVSANLEEPLRSLCDRASTRNIIKVVKEHDR